MARHTCRRKRHRKNADKVGNITFKEMCRPFKHYRVNHEFKDDSKVVLIKNQRWYLKKG